MPKRSTYIKKEKQVEVSERMMLALALDLQELHDRQVYNLHYWPAAREVVSQFLQKAIDNQTK